MVRVKMGLVGVLVAAGWATEPAKAVYTAPSLHLLIEAPIALHSFGRSVLNVRTQCNLPWERATILGIHTYTSEIQSTNRFTAHKSSLFGQRIEEDAGRSKSRTIYPFDAEYAGAPRQHSTNESHIYGVFHDEWAKKILNESEI